MGTGSLHLTYKISMVQTAVVSILDDARLFFSAQTDFATLQDNFEFLNPTVIDIGRSTIIAKVQKRS